MSSTRRSSLVVGWLGGGLLLSTLLTVAIMTTLQGTAIAPFTPTTATGTIPLPVPSGARAASCVANAQAIEAAIQGFNVLSSPAIGTETGIILGEPDSYGTATQATRLFDLGFLRVWPGGLHQGFAFSLSTTTAGELTVHVPATSRVGVNFDREGSTMGCRSL